MSTASERLRKRLAAYEREQAQEEPEKQLTWGQQAVKTLNAIGTAEQHAALAGTRAAVGALKLGQETGQGLLGALNIPVPKKGDSVLSDVLVHGGSLGMEELNRQRSLAGTAGKVGSVAGDVGLFMAASSPYGRASGTMSWEAIKQGLVKPAAIQGALSGGAKGLAGGFATSLSEGRKPLEVAQDTAVTGIAGGVIGGVVSGTMAGTVKGYNALKPAGKAIKEGAQKVGDKASTAVDRFKMSKEQGAKESEAAKKLLYGDGMKTSADGKQVKMTAKELKALEMVKETGGNPGDAAILREANPKERIVMKRMFDLAEKNVGTRAPDQRPLGMAGEKIIDNINKIDDFRKDAWVRMDAAAKVLPNKPLDISSAKNIFGTFLEDNSVKITGEGLDFSQSVFRDNVSAQKEIFSLWSDLAKGQARPAEIITIRKRLFNSLKLVNDKKDIYGPMKTVMSMVRDELNKPLAAVSDAYAQAATDYAITRGTLSDWYKKVGLEYVEGFKPAGDVKVAQVMKRFLGNAAGDYVSLLEQTDNVFKHFGFQPSINVKNLLRWDAAIEDIFGTTQTQSLRGQVSGGVGDAINPAVDVLMGRGKGLLRTGAKIAGKALGMTKEAQRKAYADLLWALLRGL